MSVREKRSLISPDEKIPIKRQCELFELHSSTYYYDLKVSEDATEIMNEIRDIWTEYPFYGYRRITLELASRKMEVNHKRVLRLMKLMGLRSVLPKPRINTSVANKEDSVRPYLLKDLIINRANQVLVCNDN